MFQTPVRRRSKTWAGLAALVVVCAAHLLASAPPAVASVSDRPCSIAHVLYRATLYNSGGNAVGTVWVTREGKQLCAVTRSTCTHADCPRQSMSIIIWGAYKSRSQNKYEGRDVGDFKWYAGRVRLPYDRRLCYQVEGNVGTEKVSTLGIKGNCINR